MGAFLEAAYHTEMIMWLLFFISEGCKPHHQLPTVIQPTSQEWFCPSRFGSVDSVCLCTKGPGFDYDQGHIPQLQT